MHNQHTVPSRAGSNKTPNILKKYALPPFVEEVNTEVKRAVAGVQSLLGINVGVAQLYGPPAPKGFYPLTAEEHKHQHVCTCDQYTRIIFCRTA